MPDAYDFDKLKAANRWWLKRTPEERIEIHGELIDTYE